MLPDMSADGGATILNSARFPVWWAGSIVAASRIMDVVTFNGRVRSVLLEAAEPRLLVQSRFRMRADDEPDAFNQFASDALDYWASSTPDTDRASSTRVRIADFSWQLRPVGYGVLGGSTTLERVGYPSAAVDVALGSAWPVLELVELSVPGSAS